jgi:hypothetical protein
MDLNRLRALVAAPVASLFLILLLCVLAVQRPVSAGIQMPLMGIHIIPAGDCFQGLSDRDVIVRIQNDGSTWINETRLSPEEIRKDLTLIYENRAERYLFFVVDPGVSFGEFADLYSKAASSTPDLHIGLLSRGIRGKIERCPPGAGCTYEWPNLPFNNYCENDFWRELVRVRSKR